MKTIENVPVLAVGKWNGIDFDSAALDAVVASFGELNLSGRLPVKLGHTTDDTQPAQGWITALRREGDQLLATLEQVPDALVEDIKQGRWRHVSVELLRNVERRGKKFPWVLDGVAVLGAARPAVDVLEGLHTLFTAGMPGLRFAERLSFSRELEAEPTTPLEKLTRDVRAMSGQFTALKAENAQLSHKLALAAFEQAIVTGSILPREREAFLKRYGSAGTEEQAREWIATASRPVRRDGQMTMASQAGSQTTSGRPDEELTQRIERLRRERKKEDGVLLDYAEASRLVLAADPDLARQYIEMPAEMWGRT